MDLQLENDPLGYRVGSFVNNTVTIGEVRYTTSLIVTPEKVVRDWPPQHPGGLTIDDFGIILALEPELILVGTGNALRFPDSVILRESSVLVSGLILWTAVPLVEPITSLLRRVVT